MFRKNVVEKIKTNFIFEKAGNVENFCRARQSTDDKTTHAHSTLDNQGY